MGVRSYIKISVLTNDSSLSEFIQKLTTDFWNFKNEHNTFYLVPLNDNDDFGYQNVEDISEVYYILDKREFNKELNAIVLWDKSYDESFGLIIHTLESNYKKYERDYEITISLDHPKIIDGGSRLTDFGHYLSQLIPKLITMNCYVYEVNCYYH